MGLNTWENAPGGKILKSDVKIAKNYLNKEEIETMGLMVNAFLDLAESRAKRKIPTTMEDWAKLLDNFLSLDQRQILKNSGAISAKKAQGLAETEFGKFRIVQDHYLKVILIN